MARSPQPVPAALASGPFARRSALAHVTDRTLAGPAYQSVLRGAHAEAGRPITHGERIRAAQAVLPAGAVLAGRSALWAWGVEMAGEAEAVEVVLPPAERVRQRSLVTIRGDVLARREVTASPWGPVTTPARTAFDLGRRGGLRESVPMLDALARATGVTADDVAPVIRAHRRARYISRLPAALELMDGRAESVRESLLRLLVLEAGFPRPVLQYEIRDHAGRFVARVDLAWPDRRIALEYDGAHHDDVEQIVRDRQRLNALQLCGWAVAVVDRHQFLDEAAVVAMIRSLGAAARSRR